MPDEPINLRLLAQVVALEDELAATHAAVDERERTIRDLENQLRTGANRDVTLRDAVARVVEQHGRADRRARRFRAVLERVAGGTLARPDVIALVRDTLNAEDAEDDPVLDPAPTPSPTLPGS